VNRLHDKRDVPPGPVTALEPGAEPLPGYQLVEPLGKGGFGEVWKCEVSGGLFKAIKFVRDAATGGFRNAAAQELEALQWIKGIRHPFLLSIERIELLPCDAEGGRVLVLVMELADQSLNDLYESSVAQGQPGIARPLLLSLLREVAEVLDLMSVQYDLQHLDIKPHNVFLVGAHAKVGDFGLVAGLGGNTTAQGGLTPLYAAPERLRGTWSRTTDQYSLAIVYQQMLTGQTPYRSPSPSQLARMHQTGTPDLSALSPDDRAVLIRALARDPAARFPTCGDFVEALVRGERLPGPSAWLSPAAASGSGLFPRVPGRSGVVAAVVPSAGAVTRYVAADPARSTPVEFLPGYQLVACQEQTALYDLWTVRDPAGRERLAHWLLQPIDPPPRLIADLERLCHPGLARTEVVVSPTRRLVLLGDPAGETLRDRLEACQADGLPGVPRDALFRWLEPIAEALDWLHAEAKTTHLGLTPSSVVLHGGEAVLREAGLIPWIWLPLRKTAAALAGRYAAPETTIPGGGEPASDQYSLALVYVEAVTGVHPRRGRGLAALKAPPDLDLFPARERPVLARALDDDPDARFPSCRAFLDALAAATQDSTPRDLPPVVPVAVLRGQATPPDGPPPPDRAALLTPVVQKLAGEVEVRQAGGVSYRVLPGGDWECTYPVQFVLSTLPLKVEGFRHQWNGRKMPSPDPDTHVVQLIVKLPRTSLFQFSNPEGGIEIVVRLVASGYAEGRTREAHIVLRPVGGNLPEARKLLEKQGPRLIASLRTYLHPAPEQRGEPRWPFPHPVAVWVEAAGGWESRPGRGVDLSRGGVRLALDAALEHDVVYVEFPGWKGLDGLALRGRVRRQFDGEGSFEYGLSFE